MILQATCWLSIRRHRARVVLHLVHITALVLTVACSMPLVTPAPSTGTATHVPEAVSNAVPVHNFTLTTLAGETVSLHELRGRWVILNFWATWCLPCREEMPFLQQLADSYAADVVVLGVNMREDASTVAPFVEQFGITFPILMYPDDAMLLAYGTRGLPLTYVIRPDGIEAYQQYGPLRPEEFSTWLNDQMDH